MRANATRAPARLAGVGHSTIYRWMDSGRLPGRPPWTVAEVKDAAASGSASQRGPREPHGTLTRYRRGCDCTACLVENAAAKHEPPDFHELAPELEGTTTPVEVITNFMDTDEIKSVLEKYAD